MLLFDERHKLINIETSHIQLFNTDLLRSSKVSAQIENFMSALDSYFLDTGKFPTPQQGLAALRVRQDGEAKWNGPYLKKEIPVDPWGTPFVYRTPGRSGGYEVISYGADAKEGGEGDNADINSWESKK